MRVLIFAPYFTPGFKGGGPIQTLSALVKKLGKTVDFKVLTSDCDFGEKIPYKNVSSNKWVEYEESLVCYCSSDIKGWFKRIRVLLFENHDVIYLNSFFSVKISLIPFILSLLSGRKIILAPRGEFSPGALEIKPFKKNFYIKLYSLFRIHKLLVFHASTEYEKQDILRCLKGSDVQIARNLKQLTFTDDLQVRKTDVFKLVFLSRITHKKNLLFAIESLSYLDINVVFDIYGVIEDQRYWEQCGAAINSLPDNVVVNYRGELQPEEVVEVLSTYDLFYFPTKGENYGHVIVEAFCAGLPALLSDQTPWNVNHINGLDFSLPLSGPKSFMHVIKQCSEINKFDYLELRKNIVLWSRQTFINDDDLEDNVEIFKYTYGGNK